MVLPFLPNVNIGNSDAECRKSGERCLPWCAVGVNINQPCFPETLLVSFFMIIVPIVTLDERALEPYKTLRRPIEHERNGIFVAEGEKVVRRLLTSSLEVLSVLLTPEWLEEYRPILADHPGEYSVFVASKQLVETIVGYNLHQGIMAVAKIPALLTLPQAIAKSHRPALLVAVDGLTNAENLGVLVRNCAAFGVDALLVGETSSSPYLRRAVRNSMGTVFTLPVVRLDNLVETIRDLQSTYHMRVLAAHPHAERGALHEASLSGDCCIVFGSEGEGISEAVRTACDESVVIPMSRDVDSLNVASASAVFLYEVQRQRNLLLGDGGRQNPRDHF
jgi:tRNA G18 (ribose-2'-O)-methylase SpoU